MTPETKRVLREETGRTAVWLFFSIIGWSLLFTSIESLSPTLLTLSGSVLLTAAGMSALVAAIRLKTGRELKGGDESKDLLLVTTLLGVGFYLLWAALSDSWTAVTALLVVVVVLTVLARLVRPELFDYAT